MIAQPTDFLGIPLSPDVTLDDVCNLLATTGTPCSISFVNPAAWAVARRHPAWLKTLRSMDIVLADGAGVAKAYSLITHRPCPRISFDMSSLADPFFKAMVHHNRTLVLVGSIPGVADSMQEKLQRHYPGITVRDTLHGYGDLDSKITKIMAAAPDVVLVGMGAPRQEELLVGLKAAGFQGIGVTCGGFLDQYVQATHYYPKWVDRYNLRFAYRLFREPKRLWRRYLIDYQVFIGAFVRACVMARIPKRS